MPANSKYLSTTGQRIVKLTAGIIGGFLLTCSLHMSLAVWLDKSKVIITMAYSGFILWAILMIIAFLTRNGWKIWGIYVVAILICSVLVYIGNT